MANDDQYSEKDFERTPTVFSKSQLRLETVGEPQAREVLSLLPPGACIAGGYLLDYRMGVTPKDMDIFFFKKLGPKYEGRTFSQSPEEAMRTALLGAGYKHGNSEVYGCTEV